MRHTEGGARIILGTVPENFTSVFLFGFSRGALIARHFAAWLDKLGISVAYLGLWDTVDATIGLDVAAECPRPGCGPA